MLIRLDKMLSNMGYGSRKEVKDLVKKYTIKIDDVVVKDSSVIIDTDKSNVEVNGTPVIYREFVYIMMNKPKGVVSATEDEKGMKTVIDLIDKDYSFFNLSCAGRLDIDTEGLMLITNDGQFIHNIISPRKEITKKYFCKLENSLNEEDITEFAKGIILADGYKCLPAKLEILTNNNAFVYISEGKFHQIKRMFMARRNKVNYLKRIAIGGLTLDENLMPGEYRELTQDEKQIIFK